MKKTVLLPLVLSLLYSCKVSHERQIVFNDTAVNADEFSINLLSPKENFYYTESIADSLFYNYRLTDSSGIVMMESGDSIYYNPVQMAHLALYFISTYHNTQGAIYLDWAIKYADKLIELSKNDEHTLLFPYWFDFPLHGYEDFPMSPPWYSAMAQGQALTLFSRLYTLTMEEKYLEYANLTYNSFYLQFDEANLEKNWVSVVDENNYLWLEEYPFNPANYTLNGFLFALFGVYDYYLIRPETEVYDLLCATLTTAKYNIPRFRSPNEASYYCLAHKVQADNYHTYHIKQIKFLYRMTNDEEFNRQATQLSEDH